MTTQPEFRSNGRLAPAAAWAARLVCRGAVTILVIRVTNNDGKGDAMAWRPLPERDLRLHAAAM